ncbi:hypothetical protein NG796_22660 [Laspinema sp. A4]|uniref:hypothetical protein n=1 Tax=Laspinema sp. D2d TaxID=2953686 RepID=UPI0021BA3C22|nr:hypothetical protein [Laspinema sp. D2d]MCT7986083.1 hypothetical protein [Laspinema sp. D2d]
MESHRGQTLEEYPLEGVFDRNGSQVKQTLHSEVSFLHSQDCIRVDPGITDAAFRVWRGFSLDWGRIIEEGSGQRVCRKRRSAQLRSPVQSLGTSGITPVHQWNCHG